VSVSLVIDALLVLGLFCSAGSALLTRDAMRAALKAKGVDPDSAHIIAPYERFFAVYFHPDGTPENQIGAHDGPVH